MPETSRKRKSVSYKKSGDDVDDEGSDDFSNMAESEDDSSLNESSETEETKPKKKNTKAPTPPKKTQEKSAAKNKTAPTKTAKPSSTTAKTGTPSPSLPTTNISSTSVASSVIADGPPVTTDAAAKKLVLQYMKQQNRPYSLLQIFDNLHKRVPKATLERVLGVMTGPGGELLAKEYGKSKIFYVDQNIISSSLGSATSSATSLDSLQEENAILQEEIDDIRANVKALLDTLSQITQEPSDEAMEEVLAVARMRVQEKREELSRLRGRVEANPDPKALEKVVLRHNKLRQAWSERKALCVDAVDQLAEALGKKSRVVMDDLSLETDELHTQTLPAPIKLK